MPTDAETMRSNNTTRIEMELLARLGHFFEQVRADADFTTFASELRRHQVSYYIYFVSTGNMNFVMANDEVISIKSARGLLRVRSAPSHRLTSAAVIRHFAGAINFEQYCKDLASAGVFKWSAINGGALNDAFSGFFSASKAYGNDGNDTLTSSPKGTFLSGGSGTNTFNLGVALDSVDTGSDTEPRAPTPSDAELLIFLIT